MYKKKRKPGTGLFNKPVRKSAFALQESSPANFHFLIKNYMASLPDSPVLIRTAFSTGKTNILPSPTAPVRAVLLMISATSSTW